MVDDSDTDRFEKRVATRPKFFFIGSEERVSRPRACEPTRGPLVATKPVEHPFQLAGHGFEPANPEAPLSVVLLAGHGGPSKDVSWPLPIVALAHGRQRVVLECLPLTAGT